MIEHNYYGSLPWKVGEHNYLTYEEAEVEEKRTTILIRVNSHRARHKMFWTIGKQRSMFSWDRRGEFYRLSPDQAAVALLITGITKARDGKDIKPCLEY